MTARIHAAVSTAVAQLGQMHAEDAFNDGRRGRIGLEPVQAPIWAGERGEEGRGLGRRRHSSERDIPTSKYSATTHPSAGAMSRLKIWPAGGRAGGSAAAARHGGSGRGDGTELAALLGREKA